ncbi:MAG TPA: hypothetical protein VM597_07870 [Gemmataceae bacterium]|jgi:hypothetical protein|nr:hypothetical protein [Gemmataceae bacterium]
MTQTFRVGDCVRIPDGRVGRVREVSRGAYRVRVRRTTSATHQFLTFAATDLRRIDCPKGWMSPEGYVRYLRVTLGKMRQRQARSAKER